MTGRTEEIRQQVNGLLKQAVGQVEGVARPWARTVAEKLDLDRDKLVSQRNKWLDLLSVQSARLAEQDAVPLPRVVKDALGRVHDVIGAFVEDGSDHAATTTEAAATEAPSKPKPRARKAAGAGKAAGVTKRPRKRTPKSGH